MFNESFADAAALRESSIAMVAHALQSLSVPPAEAEQIQANLVAGADTLSLEDLGLDSLGAMEFCIHLELELGIVVQPEELINGHFAEDLLCLVESRLLGRSKDAQGDS
ncbi:hypothetical protein OGCDGJMD_02790 [Cyanobium usitatum str. Tous]|jgi:acyl carrier protein|uniref:acyl carrier protein n=1 Tax=Cyanobium usitatum TaxID=2304190 RepID=UPI002AD59B5E|nr:acyl carrier protein [Cyanobium usitatum]CAK6700096.1 hypothetical protein OGCDGJMD_02790 [Cyanobium usitatum str. Tous]